MEQALYILLGAFCAIVGSFAAKWYEVKTARKLRMENIIGEKKIEAYQNLLPMLTYLQGSMIQDTEENTLTYIEDNIEWLNNNRIFLPSEVYDSWHHIRLSLRKLIRIARNQTDENMDSKVKELCDLDRTIRKIAEKAEKHILKELKLRSYERFSEEKR
jgi:hypothetical protein